MREMLFLHNWSVNGMNAEDGSTIEILCDFDGAESWYETNTIRCSGNVTHG